MFSGSRGKWRFAAVAYVILLHLVAGILLFYYLNDNEFFSDPINTDAVRAPTVRDAVPTPLPVPSLLSDLDHPATPGLPELIVPVKGVQPEQLTDSFYDIRDNERGHDAIDIPAAEGTPVIAAADGVIARFFDSIPGGITIYQLTHGGEYVLYYAHLQKRADGLKIGDHVLQGQTIGHVGDTGNASPGNYHLHFSIARVKDPARYWEGDYLNPFEFFRRSKP